MNNLISISYAKRSLVVGSRERARLRTYGNHLAQYHVVVFTRSSEGYPDLQHDEGVTLYATNARTRIGMLLSAYRIVKKILRNHPDEQFTVSSQDPFESGLVGFVSVFRTHHSHQVQVHGDIFSSYSKGVSLLHRFRIAFARWLITKTQSIRVVSERIRQSLLDEGVSSKCITVLPIQAELKRFLKIGKKRNLSLQPPLKLLFVGRLAPEKNIALLLRSVAAAVEAGLSISLRVVGSGPEESNLQKLILDLNLETVVAMIPWTENIEEEFAAADIFCLSSNHEGWAMALEEAAAARLAIITTDVGCAGELLRSEREALVVPVNEGSAFTTAIKRLYENDSLRMKLAQQAHDRVVQQDESYPERWVAAHVVS